MILSWYWCANMFHLIPLIPLSRRHVPQILDNNKMDFLFGLDNLKRHRCSIDLNKNHLYVSAL